MKNVQRSSHHANYVTVQNKGSNVSIMDNCLYLIPPSSFANNNIEYIYDALYDVEECGGGVAGNMRYCCDSDKDGNSGISVSLGGFTI